MRFFGFLVLVLVFGGLVSSQESGRELTEVEKVALFDIFVEIPDDYHNVDIGGDILFTLKLVNLGGAGRIDVFLEYSVLDMDGNAILDKRETVAIETQASFLREFGLEGIPVGKYEVYARMVYADGKVADSRQSFVIKNPEAQRIRLTWIASGIVLLVAILVFLYPKIKLMREKMRIGLRVRGIVKRAAG